MSTSMTALLFTANAWADLQLENITSEYPCADYGVGIGEVNNGEDGTKVRNV
jgi:hypothetical protein